MNPLTEKPSVTLDFDTPHFLQSLFANDLRNLAFLEQNLGVQTVTREGWIQIYGPEAALKTARSIFADLERTHRAGQDISERDFRTAVKIANQSGVIPLNKLSSIRLVASRSRKTVSPRTPNQLKYVQGILEDDVSFGLGPAGTGKTYLAMAAALHMLKAGTIHRIILTRPAVEAGEALGFLPGDLKEKIAPYLRPLYDALDDMLEPEEAHRYLEDGTIEIAPLAFMRGRTFTRSFVILDEAQNTTREQMFMTLTRLGEESKIVITGDTSQIDLKTGVVSGLAEAQNALQNIPSIGFHSFAPQDIVRHPIVEKIVIAYEKHRK